MSTGTKSHPAIYLLLLLLISGASDGSPRGNTTCEAGAPGQPARVTCYFGQDVRKANDIKTGVLQHLSPDSKEPDNVVECNRLDEKDFECLTKKNFKTNGSVSDRLIVDIPGKPEQEGNYSCVIASGNTDKDQMNTESCTLQYVIDSDKKVNDTIPPGNISNSEDNNECLAGTDDCEHNCTNTPGSYTCFCRTGYKISASNSSACEDVNECLAGTDDCEHNCTNSPGSYTCFCRTGYKISTSSSSACEDNNECLAGIDDCEHNCTNTPGSYACFCRTGYNISASNSSACEDIDAASGDGWRTPVIVVVVVAGLFVLVAVTGFAVWRSIKKRRNKRNTKPESVDGELECMRLTDIPESPAKEKEKHVQTTSAGERKKTGTSTGHQAQRTSTGHQQTQNTSGNQTEKMTATGDRRETLRLLLLGKTGTGKSSTGNTIFGENKFRTDLAFRSVTSKCKLKCGHRDGALIEIVDSPGLYDTDKSQEEICNIIVQAVAFMYPGPHAVLYVIPQSRYTAEEFGAYCRIKALFDDKITNYIVVVVTGGDQLENENKTLADLLKDPTKELCQVLKECSDRILVFNNKANNPTSQVEDLLNTVRQISRQNGGPYLCPRYKNIGKGLEEEVAKRLAVVDKTELKKKKYVQELKQRIKTAEENLRTMRQEIEKREQERQRQMEKEEIKFKLLMKQINESILQAERAELDQRERKLRERKLRELREKREQIEQEHTEFLENIEEQRRQDKEELERKNNERVKLVDQKQKEEHEAQERQKSKYEEAMSKAKKEFCPPKNGYCPV